VEFFGVHAHDLEVDHRVCHVPSLWSFWPSVLNQPKTDRCCAEVPSSERPGDVALSLTKAKKTLMEATVAADRERVEAVRAFNRFWTNRIGALNSGLLGTPYSLTEARIIFELAHGGSMDLAHVRKKLEIDAGYLSRLMTRLKERGLVEAKPSMSDGRRQVVRLTQRGRAAFEDLDARSIRQVERMLSDFTEEDQRRFISALATIRGLFDPAPGTSPYVIRPLRPGDLGWVVHRHGVIYAQEHGWDESFEALIARVVAEYVESRDEGRDNAWIAEVEGYPAGCVFCVKKNEKVAKLRLLLVEPRARGMGIGSRLVEECIRFAKRAGYEQVTLWTNDVLTSARRIYEAAAFRLVDERPHHSFGHDLVGQDWLLDLDEARV
jgi:DNA-binding MarR family transcriptional regulator/GNAT superfamily N-acetyltransferase